MVTDKDDEKTKRRQNNRKYQVYVYGKFQIMVTVTEEIYVGLLFFFFTFVLIIQGLTLYDVSTVCFQIEPGGYEL